MDKIAPKKTEVKMDKIFVPGTPSRVGQDLNSGEVTFGTVLILITQVR